MGDEREGFFEALIGAPEDSEIVREFKASMWRSGCRPGQKYADAIDGLSERLRAAERVCEASGRLEGFRWGAAEKQDMINALKAWRKLKE